MAAQLAFTTITIGGTTLTTAQLVAGSGTLALETKAAETVTADGDLHQDTLYKGGTGSCKAYGNLLSLNTAPGLSETIVVGPYSGKGLCSTSYSEMEHQTTLEFKLDPTYAT